MSGIKGNAEARSERIRTRVIFGGKESRNRLPEGYKKARDEGECGLYHNTDKEKEEGQI